MRLVAQLRALLSEDNDQLQQDLNISQVIDDTTVLTEDGGTFVVPANQAMTAVPFPKVTNGKYLVLLVLSGEVKWCVNNIANAPTSLKPNPATSVDPILPYQKTPQPGVLFVGPIGVSAPVTALYLSNPSTIAARVQLAIVGEAT